MEKIIKPLKVGENYIINAENSYIDLCFFSPGKFANSTVEYDKDLKLGVYQGHDYIFINQKGETVPSRLVTINLPDNIKNININCYALQSVNQVFKNPLLINSGLIYLKSCAFNEGILSYIMDGVTLWNIENAKINCIRFREAQLIVMQHSEVHQIEQIVSKDINEYIPITILDSYVENIKMPFCSDGNLTIKRSTIGNVNINEAHIMYDTCKFVKGTKTTLNIGTIKMFENDYKIRKGYHRISIKEEGEKIHKFEGKIKLLKG